MLSGDFPNLHITEIIADYNSGLAKACKLLSGDTAEMGICNTCGGPQRESKIILFLGSSIGNLDPVETAKFLRAIRDHMNRSDSLVVGFDLQKDVKILEAAYNDGAGMTAEFDLNILKRINTELGGHFDLSSFVHHAFYNKAYGRIEMHLVSLCEQTVPIDAIRKKVTFRKGETIHTENSYKYTFNKIEKLARRCRLDVKRHFTDEKRWFDLCLLKAG
jgi:uncharacterized SAM-dependent methyltransferase